MKTWSLLCLALVLNASAWAAPASDARGYHREHRVTLPGAGSSWGFIALDPSRPYLYLARRENGLSVFDVDQQRPVKTLEQSAGANGVVLVPELDRLLLLKGDGSFFMPMRDEGQVARLSTSSFAVLDTWRYPQCSRPSALAQDAERGRLFIACRGEQPQLLVVDRDSGALKASLPIGRDVNALAYDPQQRVLLIPSGVDASLTLVDQLDADHYRLRSSVSTTPMAYNMAFDPGSKRVYLAAMDFTQPLDQASPAKADPPIPSAC